MFLKMSKISFIKRLQLHLFIRKKKYTKFKMLFQTIKLLLFKRKKKFVATSAHLFQLFFRCLEDIVFWFQILRMGKLLVFQKK